MLYRYYGRTAFKRDLIAFKNKLLLETHFHIGIAHVEIGIY